MAMAVCVLAIRRRARVLLVKEATILRAHIAKGLRHVALHVLSHVALVVGTGRLVGQDTRQLARILIGVTVG